MNKTTNKFSPEVRDRAGYGDVVDGARNRHLMCQDGSVERTNGRTIHHEDDYHSSDDWPRHRQEQFFRSWF